MHLAAHERAVGGSDEWYTPPFVFDALSLMFDLDPCSPGPNHWVPAHQIYTKADDGLTQRWHGVVFVNPPYGGRHGHVPWLIKFLDHANGVAIVRAYTSADWFHEYVSRADSLLFPRGKTKFIPNPENLKALSARSRTGTFRNAPGHGVVLIGMGSVSCDALRQSGLGMYWDRREGSLNGTRICSYLGA